MHGIKEDCCGHFWGGMKAPSSLWGSTLSYQKPTAPSHTQQKCLGIYTTTTPTLAGQGSCLGVGKFWGTHYASDSPHGQPEATFYTILRSHTCLASLLSALLLPPTHHLWEYMFNILSLAHEFPFWTLQNLPVFCPRPAPGTPLGLFSQAVPG